MFVVAGWYILIVLTKALWNRTKALYKFLADHIRWVIGIAVYCWIAATLGNSDSATEIAIGGVMYTALIVAGLIGAYVVTNRARTDGDNRDVTVMKQQTQNRRSQ